MKPFKALRLPTEMDFSQVAIEEAVDLLGKHVAGNELKKDGFKWKLRVSQEADDLIRVIDLARAWNFNLRLLPKYEWDEWSIACGIHESLEEIVVWSPGA